MHVHYHLKSDERIHHIVDVDTKNIQVARNTVLEHYKMMGIERAFVCIEGSKPANWPTKADEKVVA